MPDYTVGAVVAAVAVVGLERWWFKTGLFTTAAYWITLVIVFAFQVLVDGWLTKLSAPIVEYNRHQILGLRFPWDIPVEDFLYAFAFLTLVLLQWERHRRHA
jgi:lycopene cyclase domain-containing protein